MQITIEEKYGQPIADLLRQLYNDENKSAAEIGIMLNVGPVMIAQWLDECGIPHRSRSEAIKLQWRNNEERRAAFGKQISEWHRDHPLESMAISLKANLILQNTSPTSIERTLMNALDAAGIKYVFQFVVGDKFLCDFAFPESMLIVECDGTYWHSTPKQRRRDASKDAYLQACGYTVLRFSDKQIEKNVDACVQSIRPLLHL